MSTDNGTAEKVKGVYTHPEFPERSIERLRNDAANFDLNHHLVALLFTEPFYADVIRSLHKEATESITTAGVLFKDGIMRMWWNPLFLAAYTNAQVRGILKHEALHLCLEHTTTRRYEPHTIWNWACDLAINCTLSEDEFPKCGLRPGTPLNRPANWTFMLPDEKARHEKISALIASFPRDLSSEEYFTKLMEDPEIQQMVKESKGLGFDDHEGWDEVTDEDREWAAGKVRQAVARAQERADEKNGWGSIPSSMREEIRRKVRGEIDWKAVLRHFVGVSYRADRTSSIHRLNRKYPGIHSGTSRDYKPRIGCFIDQSGSMSDDDITLCFGELGSLSHRVDILVYHFDCTVDESSRTHWKRGLPMPKALRTRSGGTDFEAVTKWVHDSKEKFDAYIILTDGGAGKPSHSRIRRAWVLVPGQSLAWGEADAADVVVKMKKPLTRER
jgi:predicted metal-dependent peptidase